MSQKVYTPTEEQAAKAKWNRENLRTISKNLKPFVQDGTYANTNEALKAQYAKDGHTELRTIAQWNQMGYIVKKGQTALKLWGKQRTSTPKNGIDPYEFFPIAYVFSLIQVEKRNYTRSNVTDSPELSTYEVSAPLTEEKAFTAIVDDLPF